MRDIISTDVMRLLAVKPLLYCRPYRHLPDRVQQLKAPKYDYGPEICPISGSTVEPLLLHGSRKMSHGARKVTQDCLLSTVYCLLSTMYCSLSTVIFDCHLLTAYCQGKLCLR